MKYVEVNNYKGELLDEKTILRTADIQVAEDFTFSKFMLSDKLLKSLQRLNFVKPSPIQLKVIPLAKCGLDMIMQAKSGTGKTLAFAICLLENYDVELKYPQSLIVVPTREIAVQIVGVLNDLGSNLKHFKASEFIGGTEVSNDRKKIQTTKVIVGTPGRILHIINSEIFNISSLKTLVLDEADKLLENGQMAKDVNTILKMMHRKIQILATTATVTERLEKIMKKVMKNPIGVTPKQEIPVLLGIKQFVKILPREDDNIVLMNEKIEELNNIFTRITFKQCLLFTDSQSKTESYGNYLNKRGWKNEVINGAQDQSQRLQVLDNLIKFKCRILITTDLMARGIDIENINLIINLDLPYDCFTYLHRIGRAGRFGTHGIAITFVNGEEDLLKYQKMLGDIGGGDLKALKYPETSILYDFWNFEQKDEEILETVSGFAKESSGGDRETKSTEVKLTLNEEETVMNNLALLEITRKLIDDDSKKQSSFDFNAMLEEYEKSSMEVAEAEVEGCPEEKLDEENIFMKAIEELNLYDDRKETEEQMETLPEKESNEVRQVIFKRTNLDDENEFLSPISSDSESSCDDDGEESVDDDENTDSDKEFEGEEQTYQPAELLRSQRPTERTVKAEKKPTNTAQPQQNIYDHYVANHYSQWENMFQYQLSNIQNYVQSSRKYD